MFTHFRPFQPKDVLRFNGLNFDMLDADKLPVVARATDGAFWIVISGLTGKQLGKGVQLSIVRYNNVSHSANVLSLGAAEYLSTWLFEHTFEEGKQLLLSLGGK